MADDIIEISDTPVLTERGDATDRSRLKVESQKWLLSKALPKVYGDKQTIERAFKILGGDYAAAETGSSLSDRKPGF
jgi:hypothetical protein